MCLGRMLQCVAFTYWCYTCVVAGVTINLLQLLVLPLYWLQRHTYDVIINATSYLVFAQFTYFAEWWGDIHITVHGEDAIRAIRNEKSIVVLNHYTDVDWLCSLVVLDRLGGLMQHRVLMKNVIKFIPVIGWTWWFVGNAFVRRNWHRDRISLLKFVENFRKTQFQCSLCLFSEGTRRTPEKLKASQEYAISKNIRPFNHHLVPRSKGFAAIACALKDDVAALYNVQLAFPEADNSHIVTWIQRGSIDVHLHLTRISMSEVPCENLGQASEYLMRMFKEKDELMEHFENAGNFGKGQPVAVPRRTRNLFTFLGCATYVFFLSVSVMYGLCVLYGTMCASMVFCALACVTCLISLLCTYLTQANRGSSFGLKKKL